MDTKYIMRRGAHRLYKRASTGLFILVDIYLCLAFIVLMYCLTYLYCDKAKVQFNVESNFPCNTNTYLNLAGYTSEPHRVTKAFQALHMFRGKNDS